MKFAAPENCGAGSTVSVARRRLGPARVAVALAALAAVASLSHGQTLLVTHDQAARHGLERAWFAQIPLDPSRSRVSTWYLYFDRLYGVTDSGIVTALNAETGEQLWSKQVGKPGYPAFGPGANSDFLGIVSGAKLYVLDRSNGRTLWARELGSAPSSGPALSENYAFVALMTGRIEGYKLDDPAVQPWYYQSNGRTFLRPTITGRVVSWPTTAGYLYVADAEEPAVMFRLETNDDIVTSPAASGENLYIASLDGYLYCMQLDGQEKWRYSTGYSIHSSPAIVGQQLYVASVEPALHALNGETGELLWTALGISHFAAQGRERVYASDRFGNVLIMDAKSGNELSRMEVAEGLQTLVNDQSDRIFVVNDLGLVQCLREIGATQPTLYRQPPPPPTDSEAEPAAAPEATPPPTEEAPPAEAEPAEDAGGPFAADDAGQEPMEEPAEPAEEAAPEVDPNDNPFD